MKIDGITITNHLGVKKQRHPGFQAYRSRNMLRVYNKETNPSLLSEAYFIFAASDGYKWNEIFNTSTGENTFIIVAKDNKVRDADSLKVLSKVISQRVP